ncbi:transglycosylase domain-containing protein [Nocardioides agariphilus]|uniref:Transglycosylase domain-containing protein n=1 Tax=Nocardioides agariphilus TaxID=433664 RepID=A0A930VPY0_9ACTN|nr:transglycosylase domain-containing protein [Nocardioides agariphilus]MBF4767815.1 transglycosylase domain-containing protein [Nocardioides agariphilus]
MPRPRSDRLTPPRVLGHVVVMLAVAAVMGLVAAGLAIPFAGVLGVATKQVASGMTNLPEQLETEPLSQRTQMVDEAGNVIATLYDENRVNVPLRSISRKMVKAIVAIEDYRFYQHGALDLKGTLRALITNQANNGVVQGGSSITQQMVKMTLIAQAKGNKKAQAEAIDDTYARKVRELRYAIAFEQHYSKDWILERYLNLAYFGDGAYGIQSAAKHYFNKNAKDLDWGESAVLAGLVKNPTGFDPTNYPDKALERRDIVLDRMAQLSVISDDKAEQLKKKGLGLHVVATQNGCVFSRAPFFCDYVLRRLYADKSLGDTLAERKALIKNGGLTIHTTIDLRMQAAADKSVSDHVYATDHAIGGMAMVEPRTGDVKALSQSRPMGNNRKKGETYLNYVVPKRYGDSAGFQAGSTFKAFVLAAAIEKGISLDTKINAPPKISIPMSEYPTCGGHNFYSTDVWEPENSTKSGTFNLYTGTQQSVNTFYAQLEKQTGLCEPYRLAKEMGIDLTAPDRERVPSFTLGVAETSPLEMATAYATFAGRGLACASRPVTSIEDADGKLLKDYKEDCHQVIQASTADAVNDILRGVQEPGGFGYDNGLALNQPSAGKTGTIQSNMAVWFMGYTPNLSTSAMIAGANDDGTWVTLNGQTVGGTGIGEAFGSTVAGPMWGDAMHVVEQWLADEDFTRPSGVDVAGVLTEIPDTGGMSVQQATSLLESLGFVVELGGYAPSRFAEDTVAYTLPGKGSDVASGTTVTIYQSTGKPPPRPTGGGGGGGTGGGGGGGDGGGTGPGNGHGNGGGKPH